jgi:hypothetical protein
MQQHPIPQNVLDVEFKLFTKFSLKEFAYLVAGILSGSIFLFLNRQIGFPGIIAWPLFLFLSGVGLFLALVPINDQGADEFIKNYFIAINKPTQRVWLNKRMKQERVKPIVEADLKTKKKIVGGELDETKKDFDEKPGDDIFDAVDSDENTQVKEELSAEVSGTNTNTLPTVTVGGQNISQYQVQIQSADRLPGNINVWLADVNNRPIPNIPVYLKDNNDKVLFANRTGPNGYFLTNKEFPNGMYFIEFDQQSYKIPRIQLVLDSNISKNPIKMTGQPIK